MTDWRVPFSLGRLITLPGKGDAAEPSISVAVATLSRPTLTTLVEPGGISVPLNAGEEAGDMTLLRLSCCEAPARQ